MTGRQEYDDRTKDRQRILAKYMIDYFPYTTGIFYTHDFIKDDIHNILGFSVVSWRGARPDVRMHPLRCRLVLHPPPPPVGMEGGESAAHEFTS
jgi:hypothetical protein